MLFRAANALRHDSHPPATAGHAARDERRAMTNAAHTLFAYGTLMFPAVFHAVTGLTRTGVAAMLEDHARYAVRGQPWPAMLAEIGARTDGCVYTDLPATAWPRLDDFEGSFYVRTAVEVTLADGTRCAAQTYLARAGTRTWLSPRAWSAEEFRRRHLANYLARGA